MDKAEGFIKFLGTAGARFVMIKQLRASGGIWINYDSTNILIDPGPGSLVRCNDRNTNLNPAKLDAIILTHKHLDHSGDINVMIEAMTEGGFRKKGVLFVPSDALGREGVIYSYLKNSIKNTIILDKGQFSVGNISFEIPLLNLHSVITWGIKFKLGEDIVSFVSDTKYFDGIIEAYKDSTIIVLNVVFYENNEKYEHLCLDDAVKIIKEIKPKKAIFTHFGLSMLEQNLNLLEEKLIGELNMDIKFAYDGFCLDILKI